MGDGRLNGRVVSGGIPSEEMGEWAEWIRRVLRRPDMYAMWCHAETSIAALSLFCARPPSPLLPFQICPPSPQALEVRPRQTHTRAAVLPSPAAQPLIGSNGAAQSSARVGPWT